MYKSHDDDTRIFTIKATATLIIILLSFIIGLFSIWYWTITLAGIGLLVWEYFSFAKSFSRKRK